MDLQSFLFSPLLTWLPIVFSILVLVLAGYFYFGRHKFQNLYKYFLYLIGAVILFRLGYAALLALGQYYLWSASEFTKLLTTTPLGRDVPVPFFLQFLSSTPLGYFIFYSYGRFWISLILTLFVAFLFFGFLKLLRRYQERFFREGEVELGLLTALIVGWPNFVIFIPLVFLSVVVVSLFRLIFLKEPYTTLGVPLVLSAAMTLILSAAVTLIWNRELIEIFNLTVLKI